MEKRTEKLEERVETLHADMVEIKVALTGLSAGLDSLNTKIDCGDLRLGSKLDTLSSKIDFGELRSSVEKAHTDIYKWVATIAIATASLGFAVHSGLKARGEASALAGQYMVQPRQPTAPGADVAPGPANLNR